MVEEKRKRGNIQYAKLHVIVVGQNIVYCWPEYCIMHLRILHIVFVGHNVTYCWSAEEGGSGGILHGEQPQDNKQTKDERCHIILCFILGWIGL